MRIPLRSLIFSLFAFTAAASENIYVWPKPISVKWGNETQFMIPLSSTFQISFPNHTSLANAVSRYKQIISEKPWYPIHSPDAAPSTPVSSTPLKQLNVLVRDLNADLQHGVDESYNLTVPSDGTPATLSAQTAWGAIWGLETFSQLIRLYNATSSYPLLIPGPLMIVDYPLFPHRGITLDTSRNFYTVGEILRTISAMSYNKINVFHWHITDSHSFPLELPSEPTLAQKGSYPGMTYTNQDVRAIIEYGRDHGVRVIPEIDAPGHTLSWAKAYPEIMTCANTFWWKPGSLWEERTAAEPGSGHLNPLHPNTYIVVKNVVNDVASMFPDHFYHGGNDEIIPGCWEENLDIQSFQAQGGDLSELLEKFVNTTHPYITAHNKTVIYWEDVLLDATIKVRPDLLPKETTILQTWNNGPNNTKRITAAGFRAIVSSADFYYLDCGHGDFAGNDSRYDKQIGDDPGNPFNYAGGNGGSWCGPFKTWQRVYDYDITYGLSEEEAKLVLGGEVVLWSEQADGTVLDTWLWPRASAMAETLWSGNRDSSGKKRYAEAIERLNQWRFRMVSRGINAEPLQPLWCLINPGMCNLNQ
ncbi:beta-hexosaminidase 2-like [Cryptomeria japonica]|uniref:beta-hexosaminidase 2-like n=1 Tax=Cryptomeria japonica TaxID=3369 RepID=UPI0027DAA2C2|nr:beta-hexosaminidase 2-like [Cryptomeria japonica]